MKYCPKCGGPLLQCWRRAAGGWAYTLHCYDCGYDDGTLVPYERNAHASGEEG